MMFGTVDAAGRALLTLQIRSDEQAPDTEVIAWVDTAFTGELVLSRSSIGALGLKPSGAIMAGLMAGK